MEKECNISHVCAGFTNSNKTLCLDRETFAVRLEYLKPTNVKINAFQARLVSFILENKELLLQLLQNERYKREVSVEDLQVYMIDVLEIDDQYVVSFVLIDRYNEPLTRDDALAVLSQICKNISYPHQITLQKYLSTILILL